MIFLLFKAFTIGFVVAMPVGPIGLLAINKSISHGFKIGFAVGLGAAIADSMYGFLAASSMAIISKFLTQHIDTIKIFGGILLLCLAVVEILQAQKHKKEPSFKKAGFVKTVIGVFFLTASNPATIFAFIAVFASFGSSLLNGLGIFTIFVAIFLGSLSWWLVLTSFVSIIKHKISKKVSYFIKIMSAFILIIFGLYTLGLFNVIIKLIN